MLVDFHVGAPSGEEAPSRPLNAVFIPDTAPRVYESSRCFDLQLAKDVLLIV